MGDRVGNMLKMILIVSVHMLWFPLTVTSRYVNGIKKVIYVYGNERAYELFVDQLQI